jgi:hypothetical protein
MIKKAKTRLKLFLEIKDFFSFKNGLSKLRKRNNCEHIRDELE